METILTRLYGQLVKKLNKIIVIIRLKEMEKKIETVLRSTLVIQNKEGVKYAVKGIQDAYSTLSTKHAKMVEMLTKMLSFKQYQRVEDFVSIEEINDLMSSIKKGGSDES